jgi:hypothetical protein
MSRLAERYSRASRSSHLKVEPTEQGDVDVVISAGLADSLGTLLLRCRHEWDSQRAAMEQHETNLRAAEEAARIEAFKAGKTAIEVIRDAANETLTSRALILMNMPSIRPTANALGRHATNRARQRNMTIEPDIIRRAAGNALDVWLDQRCNSCAGRGKNGGYGAPQIICTKCRGTGIRRRVLPSKTSYELALGEWLMAEADRLVAAAQRKMSQALR